MGIAYITEYTDAPQRQGTTIQAPQEPGTRNASSPLTFTTHVESAAFGEQTKFVRVAVNADCHYVFGPDPVATTNDAPLFERHVEVFGVYPGHKISIVAA